MRLYCVGVSHRTAPLAVRESLAANSARDDVYASPALAAARHTHGVEGSILLSTCNRIELYFTAACPLAAEDARALFADTCEVAPRSIEDAAYLHGDEAALRHLLAVAAGLDSMVPGEVEILGQVGAARERAAQHGVVDPLLGAAFETAIRAGRRARDETPFGRRPASVASEAVRQLAERLPDPSASVIAVVGTGRMATAAAALLAARGVGDLRIVGRTSQRAERIAEATRGRATPWCELAETLNAADAAFCATAARHPVITGDLVTTMLTDRDPARPLFLVDLAVPRDVEPTVAAHPGVELLDLDRLQAGIAVNLDERRQAIPQVEAIIAEEIERFETRRRGIELRPVLAGLHAWGDEIRRQELARVLQRLGPVPPEVRQHLETLASALVAKFLDPPSRRLRTAPDAARSHQLGSALRELFDLPITHAE